MPEDSTSQEDCRTDIELMLRVRGGDLHALGLLFTRHQVKVHSWCFRTLGDATGADDLVQETFLRVLRFRHTFKGQSRFTTWLYRIARNVCLDHVGTDQRRASIRERALRGLPGQAGVAPATDERRLANLEEALRRLESSKREALILSRYHDMRYDEIAAVCDSTVGAIKARVHRAIKELRQIYRDLEREDYEVRAGSTTDRRRSHW